VRFVILLTLCRYASANACQRMRETDLTLPHRLPGDSVLTRLRQDTRANTLAIMAASLVPLAGMIGGGMDMSRIYLTKTRMQHACDAGALAGRKAMGGGAWNTASDAVAKKFFDANFKNGSYGSGQIQRGFTENAGVVTGTISTALPTTLMRILGTRTVSIAVTCNVDLRLPNTDIMFVLDTTGSMSGRAVITDTDTKIEALRKSVKCFYEAVARLDTSENCATGTPSGGTSAQVQVRFGFVPYATNVNVGKLLPTSFLADSWSYQTRKANYYSNGSFRNWTYDYLSQPVSGLKNGNSWRDSFSLPVGRYGNQATINWDGCIEERETVRASNYTPIPAGAKDLDIDLVPNAGDDTTRWGPALPDLVWTRRSTTPNTVRNGVVVGLSQSQWTTYATTTSTDYQQSALYDCPSQGTLMQQWPSASAFENYVDGLRVGGNTYHDIGLLWGARFISPTGIFAASNAQTPTGGEIQRNIIFMTDGDTNAQNYDYAAYGLPWFDRRQTDPYRVPYSNDLNDQVNARFSALCSAIKNKNITLWVISFGDGSNSTTEQRLSDCATPSRYFEARDSATLQKTFAQIANQISQLRLTQ